VTAAGKAWPTGPLPLLARLEDFVSTNQLGKVWDHLVLAAVLGPEELVVQVCIPQTGACWMLASISGLLGCQRCKIVSSASKELQTILFSPVVITLFLKTYG